MTTDIELEPEIKVLRAKARDAQSDDFITGHDYVDEDGDKIEKELVAGPAGSTKEIETNLTELYTAGPATTGKVDLLVLEAEIVAERGVMENPHIPIDTETRDAAKAQIKENGHTPAWDIFK